MDGADSCDGSMCLNVADSGNMGKEGCRAGRNADNGGSTGWVGVRGLGVGKLGIRTAHGSSMSGAA